MAAKELRVRSRLSEDERARLIQVLHDYRGYTTAAKAWGTTASAFLELVDEEGLNHLIRAGRQPLRRLKGPARSALMRRIRAGEKLAKIAQDYGLTRQAISLYIGKLGLRDVYTAARRTRRELERTRDASRDAYLAMFRYTNIRNIRRTEALAGMFSGHGHTVWCQPLSRSDSCRDLTIIGLRLWVDNAVVRVRAPSTLWERKYWSISATAPESWYVAILPDDWVICFSPQPRKKHYYVPISDPSRLVRRGVAKYAWRMEELRSLREEMTADDDD